MQDTIDRLTCEVEGLQKTLEEEKSKAEEAVKEAHASEVDKNAKELEEAKYQLQELEGTLRDLSFAADAARDANLENQTYMVKEVLWGESIYMHVSLIRYYRPLQTQKPENNFPSSACTSYEQIQERESENEKLALESIELRGQVSSLQSQLGELEYAALAAKDAFDSQVGPIALLFVDFLKK